MRGARQLDLVEVAEAAYVADGTDTQWLEALTGHVARVLDNGEGVLALLVDASRPAPEPANVVAFAAPGVSPAGVAAAAATQSAAAEPTMRLRFASSGPVSTVRRTLGPNSPLVDTLEREHGVHDAYYVVAGDPLGFLAVFSAPRFRDNRLTRARTSALERIAAHIGAGVRLRKRRDAPPAAILSSSGRVEHAEGVAKSPGGLEALRLAAVASERARGRMRRESPDDALSLWRALVAGRWSLVDHFDTDGRRYIVARRNEHTVMAHDALSSVELEVASLAARGYSDKLVAYDLGIPRTTVSARLQRAMMKLGVTTRVELATCLIALEPPDPH